jgi:DNA polymerase (family 10)
MSAGQKIPLCTAKVIADRLAASLAPLVSWYQVAGSIRREKDLVGDIEIVLEPRQVSDGFMGGEAPDIEVLQELARSWAANGRLAKGEKRDARQIAVILPEGITAELYVVLPPAQRGSILAIRTGPAELGPFVMQRFKRRGLRHVGGHLEIAETGATVSTATEEEYFAAAGLPCLPPQRRHELLGSADG